MSTLPMAWLPPLVYQSMEANPHYQLYTTWQEAAKDLAEGRTRLRALLQPPPDTRRG